jgi:hypothetical protein
LNAALKLAREYGIRIEFADLGDWGVDELRSEYDPSGPVIRLNVRVAETFTTEELGEFVAFSVGHELYHHRESIGEVPRLPERKDREIAANEFARKLLNHA